MLRVRTEKLLRRLEDGSATRRMSAVAALSTRPDEPAARDAVEAALGDPALFVRLQAIVGVFELDPNRAPEVVIEELQTRSPDGRLEPQEILALSMEAPTLDAQSLLLPLLAVKDEEVREAAARVAGEIPLQEVPDALRALVDDECLSVREAAAEAIELIES